MEPLEKTRKCSAVNQNGQPCQAWAIQDSNPALCSVHAGRNQGGGAPAGNKNALKHGYYTRFFMKQELAYFEALTERSPAGELILARAMIGRLTAYVSLRGLSLEEVTAVITLILSGIRTVISVLKYMDEEEDVDWDRELAKLARESAARNGLNGAGSEPAITRKMAIRDG
jgi:hypothetical protein